jgi:predicted secreted protein
MATMSAMAIYFVLWWVVLFAVLPFGVRSQVEAGEGSLGTDPGAPTKPSMLRKLIWTTTISMLIFAGGTAAYRAGYLNIERLTKLMGFPF